MLSRREFLLSSTTAALALGAPALTPRQRVDRAIRGEAVDRTPFTFWYHFLDETKPPEQHAASTLDFHRRFGTDLVKVMSDYPYPRGKAEWFALREEANPFPQQIRALELIRDGLSGQAHFLETLFNSYKVAEKLSSEAAVSKLKQQNPQRLHDTLKIIATSQANHAKRAIGAGASGIFLAIANSSDPDYAVFSEPYDKMILQSVAAAPLNVLHIHGDKIDLSRFYRGWAASGINYSIHATKIPIATARKNYSGVILGGIDEVAYRKLSKADLQRESQEARRVAGSKFILAPGCSVPNETTAQEMLRLTAVAGAAA